MDSARFGKKIANGVGYGIINTAILISCFIEYSNHCCLAYDLLFIMSFLASASLLALIAIGITMAVGVESGAWFGIINAVYMWCIGGMFGINMLMIAKTDMLSTTTTFAGCLVVVLPFCFLFIQTLAFVSRSSSIGTEVKNALGAVNIRGVDNKIYNLMESEVDIEKNN